jgi:hypothetical protein
MITIMLIGMGAGVPYWRYVVKNGRELELIHRGIQIAEAIERYQKKNGGAAPPSLEVLVQGRYLRRLYADPMSRDGKWRLIRPGEPLAGGAGLPGAPVGAAGVPGATPTPTPTPGSFGQGMAIGPIVGVATRTRETSYRLFNGRSSYDQWAFVAGQPRVVGQQNAATGVPGLPGAKPSPSQRK